MAHCMNEGFLASVLYSRADSLNCMRGGWQPASFVISELTLCFCMCCTCSVADDYDFSQEKERQYWQECCGEAKAAGIKDSECDKQQW